jgi:hypothetical protein
MIIIEKQSSVKLDCLHSRHIRSTNPTPSPIGNSEFGLQCFGEDSGIRIHGLLNAIQELSQLSYTPLHQLINLV